MRLPAHISLARPVAALALAGTLVACSGDPSGPGDTEPDPLANAPDIAYVAWNAASRDSDIYGIQADGSDPRPLVAGPTRDMQVTWSPDGRQLAFITLEGDGTRSLSVINVDGSGRRRIDTERLGLVGVQTPAWSPDGQRIAFAAAEAGREQDGSAIYTMTPAGAGLRRLTENPRGDREPAWSPDGSQIVYTSMRPVNEWETRSHVMLYVMNADGTGNRELLRGVAMSELGVGGTSDYHLVPVCNPDWSPDGREIAFVTRGGLGGLDAIMALDVATGDLRRITPASGGVNGPPAWSPDGRRIAFHGVTETALYTMSADGTDLVRLATATGILHVPPRYRPVRPGGD